jgi:hypothetical protein
MNGTTPTNAKRAERAGLCIEEYVGLTGCEREHVLGDLLCDLMHWAQRERFDFNAALQRASAHFEAELIDEDAESPQWIERAFVVNAETYAAHREALEYGIAIGGDDAVWDWDAYAIFVEKAQRALRIGPAKAEGAP